MDRPVLLGMNNPISSEPEYALYPRPDRCTGNRVWRMLNDYSEVHGRGTYSQQKYLAVFDRRNVLCCRTWSTKDAREGGRRMRDSLSERRVVVLGVQTLQSLGFQRPSDWGVWDTHRHEEQDLLGSTQGETEYVLMPHPSGRCHEYNALEMRERLGEILLGMSDDYEIGDVHAQKNKRTGSARR